jgi:hypothetical protein
VHANAERLRVVRNNGATGRGILTDGTTAGIGAPTDEMPQV